MGLACALFLTTSMFAQQAKPPLNSSSLNNQSIKMKEFILIVRVPASYGAEDAKAVREKWNALTDQWKADNIFVTSYVFPPEGFVVFNSSGATKKEYVVSDKLKVVSTIILNAQSLDDALGLAKHCPILEQGGTIEVREVQPRL